MYNYILSTYISIINTVCHEAHYDGLLWRTQSADQTARMRCSEYHPSFQSGVYIGRMCSSNGEWGDVDFSNCTMDLDATPFIAVEVRQRVSNTTTSIDVLDTVSTQVCWFKHMVFSSMVSIKLCILYHVYSNAAK